MNKTNIEWADYTWNPIVGCLNDCPYCYARRFAERGMGEYGQYEKGKRFNPRFFPERLDEPSKVKKPSRIFVCSMSDFWGDGVSEDWRWEVRDAVLKSQQHTYITLTKQPQKLYNEYWPGWLGATVTRQKEVGAAFEGVLWSYSLVRWLCLEPMLSAIDLTAINRWDIKYLGWIVIGAMTGPRSEMYFPMPEWVEDVLDFADEHKIPVFLKDNLKWPEKRQEFPR